MKKIIIPGMGDRFRTTCTCCGCIFDFNEEDVEKTKVKINNKKSDFLWVLHCPYCGAGLVNNEMNKIMNHHTKKSSKR